MKKSCLEYNFNYMRSIGFKDFTQLGPVMSFNPWPYFHGSSMSVLTGYVVKVKPLRYLQFLVISLIHISHAFINFSCLL